MAEGTGQAHVPEAAPTRLRRAQAVEVEAIPTRRIGSPFSGRPRERTSARRYVAAQRDRTLLRLWRGAPEAISYLVGVVAGRNEFSEGKYKAAVQVLSRCVPTLTAQAIQSDSTTITATVNVDVEEIARRLLAEAAEERK